MFAARLERRDDFGRGRRVAQAHGEVAEPALEADSPDRGAFGARQERVFVPSEKIDQRPGIQVLARLEVVLAAELRVAVPRAYRLAVVAAVDAVAYGFAEFKRNRALEFYRQVGNAASGIELVRRRDRLGRADVDAYAARPAVVAHRLVGFELEVGIDFAEKEPTPGMPIQQVGVLAYPAQPGLGRQRLLHHGCRVGEHAVAERADFGLDLLRQLLEPASQRLVIVAADRIARDAGLVRLSQKRFERRCVGRQVVHAQNDHRAGARHQFGGPGAFATVARHPVHVAMLALGQPLIQLTLGVGQVGIGEPDLLEPEFGAPLPDTRLQRFWIRSWVAVLALHRHGIDGDRVRPAFLIAKPY